MPPPAYPDGFRPPDTVADTQDCDVLVVGGGINGVGIARDLAGRGYRVTLCEQDDLAAHTSSASTKLIHGGLRYLEYGEFGLVRKALAEREVLLRSAPHIMRPLRFVLPHDARGAHMRPSWMIKLGLFLYDHLAQRDILPASQSLDLRSHPAGQALNDDIKQGYAYSDGWVDDARLVVLAAVDARERGATILTRTRCTQALRGDDTWTVTLRDQHGLHSRVRAKVLVNAAGPWVESFLRRCVVKPAEAARSRPQARPHLRLVRGSHIVIKRSLAAGHPSDHAFIFQNPDGRVIFAIPYERHYTLIGTTDVELARTEGPTPQSEQCSEEEIAYLCHQANRYFREGITPLDVVWTFAGVRPLLDDAAGNPAAVTRDYRLDTDTSGAPLLSVWGGKITTFRRLAEQAGNQVGKMLGRPRKAWTRHAALPGGDLRSWIGSARHPAVDFARFVEAVQQRYRWLPEHLAHRWARAYGSRIDKLIGSAACLADLGEEIAPDVFEAELRHLVADEWATEADDILWRRTKLGLHLDAEQRATVGLWLAAHEVPPPVQPWARSSFSTNDHWDNDELAAPDIVAA